MGLKTWIAVSVVIIGVIFIMYPEPNLTPKVITWKEGGKYLQYKSYQIFYRVEDGKSNDGRTLLCLHGYPTSSYDWIKIMDGLKEHFSKIILYDFIGFGFSDKPDNHTYTIMEQADIGERILKEIKVTKVHILAHDYGDTVALELLARYNNKENKDRIPEIQTLCLSNGGIFPETNTPRPIQKLLLNPYAGPIASRLTFFFIFKKAFGEIFGPETIPLEDDLWDFFVIILHKNGHVISHRLIHYITQRAEFKDRWVGALKNTPVKVHMIYGPADPVNPDSFIDFYKKSVPQHSITVLDPKIGHYPQWEAPTAFIDAYSTFIIKTKS